jgi:hypothetical protein
VVFAIYLFQQLVIFHHPSTIVGDFLRGSDHDTSRLSTAAVADSRFLGIDPSKHLEFHSNHDHDGRQIDEPDYRVACIIPYIGEALPAWFDAFAFSGLGSSALFDWLIFVTEVPSRELPPNFKIIRITYDELYARLARLDVGVSADTFDATKLGFRSLLEMYPYVMVEFKSCLGFVFSDYIASYSHWAFADLDVLLGNAHRLITHEILQTYDIYTAAFGDNYRFYTRGQLTIHRNVPLVNNLWMECSHLSGIRERLDAFAKSGYKHWQFQSAEGCYSKVVFGHVNVSRIHH